MRTRRIVLGALLAMAAGLLPACAPVDNRPFTVVMLPDTQYYSAKFPATFTAQTRWIRENAGKENIVFVTQVGDIVDNSKAPEQWKVADEAMSGLDGVVPWGVAAGNHDYDDLDKQASATFGSHFGPKRFAGQGWYGGGTEDGQCSYQYFQGAGRRFMVLHLPFEGSEKSAAWAREVIAKNPGVPTIVSTHCYLCPGGNPFPDNPTAGRLGARGLKEKLMKLVGGGTEIGGSWSADPAGRFISSSRPVLLSAPVMIIGGASRLRFSEGSNRTPTICTSK